MMTNTKLIFVLETDKFGDDIEFEYEVDIDCDFEKLEEEEKEVLIEELKSLHHAKAQEQYRDTKEEEKEPYNYRGISRNDFL